MKLVVGLGNPGSQYARTRHNAGFMVVDRLRDKHALGEVPRSRFNSACVEARIAGEKCLLMKPTTYMNLSGRAVGEAVRFYKVEPETDLVVIVDEVAFPVGHIRVRAKGGTAGHNGLKSIDTSLGGADYPRVRIGIGTKPAMMNQADWVLSRVTEEEWPDFEKSIHTATHAVETLLAEGTDTAMNRFNERLTPKNDRPPQTHTAEDAGDVIDPGWTD
ncbi:MAG: aminoacyl-tRNA hydrolase [Phycisphaerales bacterium]|nr:aminoacyl-tRNA hydrolase [Phycisphaerales bacterium]